MQPTAQNQLSQSSVNHQSGRPLAGRYNISSVECGANAPRLSAVVRMCPDPPSRNPDGRLRFRFLRRTARSCGQGAGSMHAGNAPIYPEAVSEFSCGDSNEYFVACTGAASSRDSQPLTRTSTFHFSDIQVLALPPQNVETRKNAPGTAFFSLSQRTSFYAAPRASAPAGLARIIYHTQCLAARRVQTQRFGSIWTGSSRRPSRSIPAALHRNAYASSVMPAYHKLRDRKRVFTRKRHNICLKPSKTKSHCGLTPSLAAVASSYWGKY